MFQISTTTLSLVCDHVTRLPCKVTEKVILSKNWHKKDLRFQHRKCFFLDNQHGCLMPSVANWQCHNKIFSETFKISFIMRQNRNMATF